LSNVTIWFETQKVCCVKLHPGICPPANPLLGESDPRFAIAGKNGA